MCFCSFWGIFHINSRGVCKDYCVLFQSACPSLLSPPGTPCRAGRWEMEPGWVQAGAALAACRPWEGSLFCRQAVCPADRSDALGRPRQLPSTAPASLRTET